MNKKIAIIGLTLCLLLSRHSWAQSAAAELTPQQQTEVINALKSALNTHYVYPKKANMVIEWLDSPENKQPLLAITDKLEFAKTLTRQILALLNDKHFRVIVPGLRNRQQYEDVFAAHLNALTRFRKGGFQDIRILDGNIGYVKIDGFRGEEIHQVDGLMTYLRTVDAIIFDLSDNGGGGRPVNYLSSYFLPTDILIGKTYHRHSDKWTELRAEPVKGDKRLNVPLFIITSEFTFSAAEAFAYNLQARDRAVIVGKITGGGAHPTSFFPLNNGVAALIPNRRSYNPVTESNWEAIGVMPDIKTEQDDAVETAHELAVRAATRYREAGFEQLKTLLENEHYNEALQQEVNTLVAEILHRKHAEPFMIPGFARDYQQNGKLLAAKLLLTAHVAIDDRSADAHYLLAELLVKIKEVALAKIHVEMAIELANEQGVDAQLFEQFNANLKAS